MQVYNYTNWIENERERIKRDTAEEQQVLIDEFKNENGSKTININTFNFTTGRSTIDGHYWVESDDGEILYEEDPHVKRSPAFKNALKDDPTSFLYYAHIDPEIERNIIEKETAKQVRNWGGQEQHDRLLTMREINRDYSCFQKALRNVLLHGGRIRFGNVGVASPKYKSVFWLFGHLDNSKYEDWIVPKSPEEDVFTDPYDGITHTRETKWNESPSIYAYYEKMVSVEREKVAHAKREKDRADALEMAKKEAEAQKRQDELLAMLDEEDKGKKGKKGKSKK